MRFKFVNFISKLFSVLFFFIVAVAILSPLYYWFWYRLSAYDSVRNFVKLLTMAEFLFAVLVIVGLWVNKFYFKVISIIVYFVLIHLFNTIPEIQRVADIDNCLDINYCKEGILNSVSYDDYMERKGAWNIDDKACDYSFDLKTCKPRFEGNWKLPQICGKG